MPNGTRFCQPTPTLRSLGDCDCGFLALLLASLFGALAPLRFKANSAFRFASWKLTQLGGIALKGETADVVLMEDNLSKLIHAFAIARDAIARIKQNFTIVSALNALAFLLSIPHGLISPNFAPTISNGSAILKP